MAHNYDNASQQRILRALLMLAGNEFNGVAPGELAKAMGESPSTATRDLHNLKEVGFAEQIQQPGRRFHGVPKVLMWDKGSANTASAVQNVLRALEVLAWHRENVRKNDQPELELN